MTGPRRALIAATALAATGGPARAHSFQTGLDLYEQFVEGAGAVLGYPGTLLLLGALGLLLGLWRRDGMVRAWPAFLAGQAVGIPVAVVVGLWAQNGLLALGVVVAGLGALLSRHHAVEALGLAFLAGLIAMAVNLEGHGLFELPLPIHLGMLLGVNLVPAMAATAVGMSMEKTDAMWLRILWRVLCSWIAAILVLYLAFELSA